MLSFFKLLIAFYMVVDDVQGGKLCALCGSPYELPKRWDYPVDSDVTPWKTCQDVFLEMGSMDIYDSMCPIMQQSYKDVCCNEQLPTGWAVHQTPGPKMIEKGTEPVCKICGDDKYPGEPSKVISARYVGAYSCGELYHRGGEGLIPGFMCGPLQDYAFQKCECGPFNPEISTLASESTTASVSHGPSTAFIIATSAPELTTATPSPVPSAASSSASGRKVPLAINGKDQFKSRDFTTQGQHGQQRGLRRTMLYNDLPVDT
jgi:hypothetical protein